MWRRLGASGLLALSVWGQQVIEAPGSCAIRLLEVTPPAVDSGMIIPAQPIPNAMPAAKVPAPPCPKGETRDGKSEKPVSFDVIPGQMRKVPLGDRYRLLPNPFRPSGTGK